MLSDALNTLIRTQDFPNSWKLAELVLIPKAAKVSTFLSSYTDMLSKYIRQTLRGVNKKLTSQGVGPRKEPVGESVRIQQKKVENSESYDSQAGT